MNFLKVKNYLIVFLISFFISIGFVSAKTTFSGSVYFQNSGREAESSGMINLFEDTSNYNGFIEFLYKHNIELEDYLFNYYGISSNLKSDDYSLNIFAYDDLYWNNISYKSNSGTYNLNIDSILSSEDICYHNCSTSNPGKIYKKYNTGRDYVDVDYIISYSYDTSAVLNSSDLSVVFYPKIFFLFNSSGVSVGYILFGSETTQSNMYIDSNDFYSKSFYINLVDSFSGDNPDMTSWYAYLYKTSSSSFSSEVFDLVFPFKFVNNGEVLKVEDNAGYKGVSGWFNDLFYKHIDLDVWNMNFIYDDVFYKKGADFTSLYDHWVVDSSDVVPDSYDSIIVSDSKKGWYLTPKSGCKSDNYKLYYSTSTSVSSYVLYFNYYYIKDSILDISKRFSVFSSKSYNIYSYNPLIDLNVDSTEFLNYSINVYQYSEKYDYYLYYASSCYYVDSANDSNLVLEFDSGDYNMDSTEIQNNYNNSISNNSSSINSSGSSNNNVTNPNYSSDFEVDSVISNIGNYASDVIGSVESLVGMATIFLTGLPPMIYNFLFSVFAIGMIIFIIKLIK